MHQRINYYNQRNEVYRLHTGASQKNEKKLARSFNCTFPYIDDVLSLNKSRFGDFVDRIYPIELEIMNTTDTDSLLRTLTYTSKLTVRGG